MLGAALLFVTALFALLTIGRLAGARRRFVQKNATAIILAMAAILTALRGQALWGTMLGLGAIAFYLMSNRSPPRAQTSSRSSVDGGAGPMSDNQARAILGVAANASENEIRAAFRQRIQRAHPDRGGSNEEAARLSAARDILLRR